MVTGLEKTNNFFCLFVLICVEMDDGHELVSHGYVITFKVMILDHSKVYVTALVFFI